MFDCYLSQDLKERSKVGFEQAIILDFQLFQIYNYLRETTLKDALGLELGELEIEERGVGSQEDEEVDEIQVEGVVLQVLALCELIVKLKEKSEVVERGEPSDEG